MTVKDICQELRVSKSTVHRWVEQGRLVPLDPPNPLLQRPRRLRFARAAVDALRPRP